MKITFDSENFLAGRGRSIACVILFIIAAFLIFHLGVMCGMHRALRHNGFGGYGMMNDGQQSFNAQYYGNPSMDTQYGEAAGYSGDSMMPDQTSGMRVIHFQQATQQNGWQ